MLFENQILNCISSQCMYSSQILVLITVIGHIYYTYVIILVRTVDTVEEIDPIKCQDDNKPKNWSFLNELCYLVSCE